jgi:hypothetical protein
MYFLLLEMDFSLDLHLYLIYVLSSNCFVHSFVSLASFSSCIQPQILELQLSVLFSSYYIPHDTFVNIYIWQLPINQYLTDILL